MLAVLRMTLRDQRRTTLGWCAGFAVLTSLYAAVWPAIRDDARRYDELVAGLPDAMRGLVGDTGFGSAAGFVTTELLAVTGPLLLTVLAVLLGCRAVAGDEEAGLLDLVLAQPVSRRRLVLERAAAVGVTLLAVTATTGLVLVAAGPLVDLPLGVARIGGAMLLLALLAADFGALAIAVGAVTGRATLARVLPAVVAVGLYLAHAFASSAAFFDRLDTVSPFAVLLHAAPLQRGLDAGAVAGLALPAVALACVAAWGVGRRDLHGG